MKSCLKYILLLALLLSSTTLWSRTHRDSLGVGPRMFFSENKGQWEQQVLYKSDLRAATLFLERDCFTLVLVRKGNVFRTGTPKKHGHDTG